MKRRDFFKLGMGLFIFSKLPSSYAQIPGDTLIFSAENGIGPMISNGTFQTIFLDLKNFTEKRVTTSLNCHSYVQNPHYKNQIVGVEKWGRGMGIFNAKNHRLINQINLDNSHQFVGHGEFASRGNLFFCSVSGYLDPLTPYLGKGFIFVYETKNFNLVDKFETSGFEPHQIAFFDNEKYLLVLHPGFKTSPDLPVQGKGALKSIFPSLSVIEIKNKSLLKNIVFNEGDYSFAHLTKTINENFFLIGGKKIQEKTWQNLGCFFNPLEETKILDFPGIAEGQPLLSASYAPPSNTIGFTSPSTNEVFFLKEGNYKSIKMVEPSGINTTKDGKNFVIAQKNHVSIIDNKGDRILKQKHLPFHMSGGHSLLI